MSLENQIVIYVLDDKIIAEFLYKFFTKEVHVRFVYVRFLEELLELFKESPPDILIVEIRKIFGGKKFEQYLENGSEIDLVEAKSICEEIIACAQKVEDYMNCCFFLTTVDLKFMPVILQEIFLPYGKMYQKPVDIMNLINDFMALVNNLS